MNLLNALRTDKEISWPIKAVPYLVAIFSGSLVYSYGFFSQLVRPASVLVDASLIAQNSLVASFSMAFAVLCARFFVSGLIVIDVFVDNYIYHPRIRKLKVRVAKAIRRHRDIKFSLAYFIFLPHALLIAFRLRVLAFQLWLLKFPKGALTLAFRASYIFSMVGVAALIFNNFIDKYFFLILILKMLVVYLAVVFVVAFNVAKRNALRNFFKIYWSFLGRVRVLVNTSMGIAPAVILGAFFLNYVGVARFDTLRFSDQACVSGRGSMQVGWLIAENARGYYFIRDAELEGKSNYGPLLFYPREHVMSIETPCGKNLI